MDNLKLKIIILGDIVLKTQISRLFRTLSLLLSSGVSIVSSLDLATSVVDNQVIKEQMLKFKEQIRSGESLAKCLKDSAVFPEFATNIIRVGEETGAMEKSLKQVADDYERQVDQSLKNISRLVEPAIILVMGLIVGFIVLSMLLPIFQINLIVR
jgi:type II secretory pathway component PulF